MNSENLVDPLQIIFSLGLVVGLIFACAWIVRRTNGVKNFQPNLMTIKAVLALGPKEKIMIVKVGEEQLLLSVCTGQITLLKTLDNLVEEKQTSPSDFSEKIRQLIQGGSVANQSKQAKDSHEELDESSMVKNKESSE